MTEIYRVENKRGEGCYRCKSNAMLDAIGRLIPNYWDAPNHPQPENDIGIDRYVRITEICGFENMDQLLKWFDLDDIFELHRFGFEVKKVLVQKITAIGECQVLAVR